MTVPLGDSWYSGSTRKTDRYSALLASSHLQKQWCNLLQVHMLSFRWNPEGCLRCVKIMILWKVSKFGFSSVTCLSSFLYSWTYLSRSHFQSRVVFWAIGNTTHIPVEVGSRGWVAQPRTPTFLLTCLQKLGFSASWRKKVRQAGSRVALTSSYYRKRGSASYIVSKVRSVRERLIPKTIGNRKRDCAWGCAWGINATWENLQIEKRKSVRWAERTPSWFVLFDLQIFSGGVYSPSATSRTISFSISNSFWY